MKKEKCFLLVREKRARLMKNYEMSLQVIRHHNTQHNDIQQNDTQHKDTQHNDTQHDNKIISE
jgi:hypothetical protein